MKTNYTYKPYFLEFAHGDEMKKLNKEWYETFEHYLKVMGIKGWGTPSPNDLTNTIGYNLYNSNEEEDDYAYLLITIPNSFNDSEDNEEWNVFNIYLGEAWDEPTFVFDTIEEVLGLMISNEILIGASRIGLENDEYIKTLEHYVDIMGVNGYTNLNDPTHNIMYNVYNSNKEEDEYASLHIYTPTSLNHNEDNEEWNAFYVYVGDQPTSLVFDTIEEVLGLMISNEILINKSEVK